MENGTDAKMVEENNNLDTSNDLFDSGKGKVVGVLIGLILMFIFVYFVWYKASLWLYDYFYSNKSFADDISDGNHRARLGFLITLMIGVVSQFTKTFIEKSEEEVSFIFGIFAPISLIGFYWSGAYSYLWGLIVPETLQENIFSGLGIFVLLIVYFIPSIIVLVRRHHNGLAIGFTNLFLGWTIIGWVVAIIWSGTAVKKIVPPVE